MNKKKANRNRLNVEGTSILKLRAKMVTQYKEAEHGMTKLCWITDCKQSQISGKREKRVNGRGGEI